VKVHVMEVGSCQANCYLVYDDETKDAFIIDPGAQGKEIIREVGKLGLKIKHIVNTHGHSDHIGANEYVKEATGAPLLIHEDDAPMLTSPAKNLSIYFGEDINKPAADRLLKDGDVLDVGSMKFKVLHTPGHTPGGICLVGQEACFSGDTLFALSIGRSDFPGGSHKALINSIITKLLPLDDKVIVFPGHGPRTTIGQERVGNPFL